MRLVSADHSRANILLFNDVSFGLQQLCRHITLKGGWFQQTTVELEYYFVTMCVSADHSGATILLCNDVDFSRPQ